MSLQQVIVVGGGVIGCLSALCLLEKGFAVRLIERRRTGQEASWAGGGIVSPLYPWRYSQPVSALADWSQGFYPQLGEALAQATGIDPEVSPCGLLWLDHAEQEDALLWAAEHKKPLGPVDNAFIYQQVPHLAQGFQQALWQPQVANVRNPRLMTALRTRLLQHSNFSLLEDTPVTGLLLSSGKVQGVRAGSQTYQADSVVLAAGAWSGDWLAELGLGLPVKPVKGQMILYKTAPGWLPSMVLFDGRYAIPRRDGHVLFGSTLEHAGFDKHTTLEALESLKASAIALLPALADQQPVAQWAGLRPGSPEGVPFIGPVPGYDGLWLNTGHYRNGLVLAPASCRLLADLMSGAPAIIDPRPYAPAGRVELAV
ncbi:glycine oxidase ThiO [Halopseudomonas pelagia]|uniref:glycine oxidase ThiO n=1 Tax=Halopseudomonas pelagia TaxID=553151 RepID=UPI001E331781|nr:glycine oxidase ThiO [Halopseudomonas pelagia]